MNNFYPPTASAFTPPFSPSTKKAQLSADSTPSTSRPIHMILDFDGTITHSDTTYLLPEISRKKLRSHLKQHELLKKWERVSRDYDEALNKHSRRWNHSNPSSPTSIDSLIAYQRSLRRIEDRSATRCGELKLLGGITDEAWEDSGFATCQSQRIKIRRGFADMIAKLEARRPGPARWGIVSVNWSQHFLRGVVGSALGDRDRAARMPVLANHIDVHGAICGPASGLGSRVERDRPNLLPTIIDRKRILTSEDKLTAMKSMRSSFTEPLPDISNLFAEGINRPLERDPPSFIPPLLIYPGGYPPAPDVRPDVPPDTTPLVVYVGDSLTDIECFLEADVGIIMAPDGRNSMMQALGRCNIPVSHIAFYKPQAGNSLWFTRDFRDITVSKLLDEWPLPQVRV